MQRSERRAVRLLVWSLVGSCSATATAQEPDASGMRERVESYGTDARSLSAFYSIQPSPTRLDRLDRFDDEWEERLLEIDFEELDRAGQIDLVLLRHHLEHERFQRATYRARLEELSVFVPFAATIIGLEELRWGVERVDPQDSASVLAGLADEIEATAGRVRAGRKQGDEKEERAEDGEDEDPPLEIDAVDALRVERILGDLRSALESWYEHYDEFLPGFAWWCAEPQGEVLAAFDDYAKLLREEVAGQKDEEDDPLVGDPIGPVALAEGIQHEMLPYTPEELLAIGEEQFAWCEAEMMRASNDLGYGDDWKKALEHVKEQHVEPGLQDALVAAQAREAIEFLDEHDLVTIPDLCRETWRVKMLDRSGQRTLPFAAYGGQRMLVAYPTADMDHEEKRMAMRGNNVHFTRAVTPHELIPGHHLQGFMAQRTNTHRRIFSTPFYGEGWALYWEMLEWDLGWPKTPEDRMGMLFWRMHRAARIIVSLKFHLEQIQPDEMIEFLVERVGHERSSATSEVRRYIGGAYGPLYQCAYMIGGLQLRALHSEIVGAGRMTNREFHDAVLHQNSIPIEMVRAALLDTELTPDHESGWRFAGDVDAR